MQTTTTEDLLQQWSAATHAVMFEDVLDERYAELHAEAAALRKELIERGAWTGVRA